MSDEYHNAIDRTRKERSEAATHPPTTESQHAPRKFVRPTLLVNTLLAIVVLAAATAWLFFR